MEITLKKKYVSLHGIIDEKELREVIEEYVRLNYKEIKEIQISFHDKTNETIISPITCHIQTTFKEEINTEGEPLET